MLFDEWGKIVKTMNVLYEDKGKVMFDTPEKVKVWYSCLQDLDYRILCEAVKRFALLSRWKPSIAELREEYFKITQKDKAISEQECWDMVRFAVRDSTYNAEEHFAEFPEIVKKIVVSPSRLREWATMQSETVSSVVRAEFRRAYESATTQEKEYCMLGKQNTAIAEKVAAILSIGRKEDEE